MALGSSLSREFLILSLLATVLARTLAATRLGRAEVVVAERGRLAGNGFPRGGPFHVQTHGSGRPLGLRYQGPPALPNDPYPPDARGAGTHPPFSRASRHAFARSPRSRTTRARARPDAKPYAKHSAAYPARCPTRATARLTRSPAGERGPPWRSSTPDRARAGSPAGDPHRQQRGGTGAAPAGAAAARERPRRPPIVA